MSFKLAKCPVCSYDLTGLPATHRCPECGFAYDQQTLVWRSGKAPRMWVLLGGVACVIGISALMNARFLKGALFAGIGGSMAYLWHATRRERFVALGPNQLVFRDEAADVRSIAWIDIERLLPPGADASWRVKMRHDQPDIILGVGPIIGSAITRFSEAAQERIRAAHAAEAACPVSTR